MRLINLNFRLVGNDLVVAKWVFNSKNSTNTYQLIKNLINELITMMLVVESICKLNNCENKLSRAKSLTRFKLTVPTSRSSILSFVLSRFDGVHSPQHNTIILHIEIKHMVRRNVQHTVKLDIIN